MRRDRKQGPIFQAGGVAAVVLALVAAWPAMAGQRAIPAVDKPMAESPDQSGQRILAIAQEYAAAHSNDEKTRVMRQLAEAMWSRPLVAQYSRGGVSLPDELLQAMARDVSGNMPDAWMNEFRSLKLEGYVADRRRTELLVQARLAATGTRHAPREIFLEPYQDSARIGGLVEDEYAVSYWIRAGE